MDGQVTVLHVDDDPDFAELTADFLHRANDQFEVVTATSVAEGLDYLDQEEVDCVVSDYQMPEMDGIEFLETVRESSPDLPFILFTGQGSEEVALRPSSAKSATASDSTTWRALSIGWAR